MQHILQASAEHDYLEAQQKSLTEHVEDPYWAERRAQLSNQWARAGVSLQLMQEGVRIEDAMRTLQDQLRVYPLPLRIYCIAIPHPCSPLPGLA